MPPTEGPITRVRMVVGYDLSLILIFRVITTFSDGSSCSVKVKVKIVVVMNGISTVVQVDQTSLGQPFSLKSQDSLKPPGSVVANILVDVCTYLLD